MGPKVKEVILFFVEKNLIFFNSTKLVSSTNYDYDPIKPNKVITHTRKHSFQINFELEARLQNEFQNFHFTSFFVFRALLVYYATREISYLSKFMNET